MLLTTLSTTDKVFRYYQCIVIPFNGVRRVLSTTRYNGGLRDDIKAVFNHDCTQGRGMPCKLLAPTYAEHIGKMGLHLGFDSKTVTGMCTAASMDNVAIISENYLDLTVTAIVTGGIDKNGGRVGDPAKYHEPLNNSDYRHGTINIILVINANLPPGAITRALVICSEAKAAALQELMAGSNYSNGIATGSGTDETIIVANLESSLRLEDAGKHTKLGELIGNAVKQAVKKALFLQTGLSPQRQHDVLWRMKRFGVTEEALWEVYQHSDYTDKYSKPEFISALANIRQDNTLVCYTALIAHALDEYNWGLLSQLETEAAISVLLRNISNLRGISFPAAVLEINQWLERYKECMVFLVCDCLNKANLLTQRQNSKFDY